MASKTVEAVLFPGIDVRVECVSDSSDVLVVEAASTARPGRCPDCRKQARRVHSMYQRALNERPLGSHRVVIRLRVRRYFCDRKTGRTVPVRRSSSRCRACPSGTAAPAPG
ncbi:transposase family protein [Streptomyces sp. NPDC001165]|uniref:transposase family protein n=1 Tax=Streptomyces sp. NPDC001165 TaxID=3364546 RepID=UPI0036C33C8A